MNLAESMEARGFGGQVLAASAPAAARAPTRAARRPGARGPRPGGQRLLARPAPSSARSSWRAAWRSCSGASGTSGRRSKRTRYRRWPWTRLDRVVAALGLAARWSGWIVSWSSGPIGSTTTRTRPIRPGPRSSRVVGVVLAAAGRARPVAAAARRLERRSAERHPEADRRQHDRPLSHVTYSYPGPGRRRPWPTSSVSLDARRVRARRRAVGRGQVHLPAQPERPRAAFLRRALVGHDRRRRAAIRSRWRRAAWPTSSASSSRTPKRSSWWTRWRTSWRLRWRTSRCRRRRCASASRKCSTRWASRDLRQRRISTLSGGEKQRVAIAAVLALQPADPGAGRADLAARPAGRRRGADRAAPSQRGPGPDRHPERAPAGTRRAVRRTASCTCPPSARRPCWTSRARSWPQLPLVPPLVELGRTLGWQPLPLTIKEGRPFAAACQPQLAAAGRGAASATRAQSAATPRAADRSAAAP